MSVDGIIWDIGTLDIRTSISTSGQASRIHLEKARNLFM